MSAAVEATNGRAAAMVEVRYDLVRSAGDNLLRYMKHSTRCAMRQGLTKRAVCICGAWDATDEWKRVRPDEIAQSGRSLIDNAQTGGTVERRVKCRCGAASLVVPWNLTILGMLCTQCDNQTGGHIEAAATRRRDPQSGRS